MWQLQRFTDSDWFFTATTIAVNFFWFWGCISESVGVYDDGGCIPWCD